MASSNNSNEGKFTNTGESSNRFNHLNTINKKESTSNSKYNDVYDLKNEIKLLQNKINGLGKTLCNICFNLLVNKKNTLIGSSMASSRVDDSCLPCMKIKDNTISLKPCGHHEKKKNLTVSLLKNSNANSRKNSPKKLSSSLKKSKSPARNLLKISYSSKSVKNQKESMELADYKTYCHREAITMWKEKYYKIVKDDTIVTKALEEEKRKNEELLKYRKNLEQKWNNYDKINYKYNKLIDEYEKLLIRYDESEMIRKEQSNLIKTLKKELHALGKWTQPDPLEENYEEKM